MTDDFPDRNLDHLHQRVASGVPRRPDGQRPISRHEVPGLPVGTVLRDDLEADPSKFAVWVRFDNELGDAQVFCVTSTFDGGMKGQEMDASRLANAVIVGAVPGTPAASA